MTTIEVLPLSGPTQVEQETNQPEMSENSDNSPEKAPKKMGRPKGAADKKKRKTPVRKARVADHASVEYSKSEDISALTSSNSSKSLKSEDISASNTSNSSKSLKSEDISASNTSNSSKSSYSYVPPEISVPEARPTIVAPSLPEPDTRELIYQYHTRRKEREEAQWMERIKGMMVRPTR